MELILIDYKNINSMKRNGLLTKINMTLLILNISETIDKNNYSKTKYGIKKYFFCRLLLLQSSD